MAKVAKAKKTVDEAKSTVHFVFSAGGEFLAELSKVPAVMVHRLALHGIAQKLGDAYAGDVASPEHEVRTLFAQLCAGTWSDRQPAGPHTTLLIEAIAEMRAKANDPKAHASDADLAAIRLWIEDLDEEQVKALRKDPEVKAMMATIQANRARAEAGAAKKAGVARTVQMPF